MIVMCGWFLRPFGGDVNDPCGYSFVGSTPPSCPGTGKICAIYGCADERGCLILTEEIQQEMIEALSSGLDQPYVLLRAQN